LKHAAFGALLLACLSAGCDTQPYRPQALSPEAAAGRFLARSPEDPSVRRFLEENGITVRQWPLPDWGVTELTVLAMYFHPDLAAARANVAVFQAALEAAAMPPVPSAKPLLEHHSRTDGGQSRWTYGIELELPLAAAGKREARREQAQARMESAQVDADAAAWEVASRLRHCLLEALMAEKELALAEQGRQIAAAEAASARRRLDAGGATSAEAAEARRNLDRAWLGVEQARARAERSRALIAGAVGLPVDAVRPMKLNFTALETLPPPPESEVVRDAALQARADLRRALLRYQEADSALKLAVANQFPDLQFKPGYLWDQGDHVWLLALTIPLQLLQDRSAPVREAEAIRELEARNFEALQARAIAESEVALAGYRAGIGALTRAQDLEQAAQEETSRATRALAAGAADRAEVLAADTVRLGAERDRQRAAATAQRARLDLEDAMYRRLGGPATNSPVSALSEAN